MKKHISPALQEVRFEFEGLESVTLRMADVTQANRDYAMLHGFAARIGDNAAIQKSAENGYKVTEDMRREAVLELVNHYASGSTEWNVKAKAKAPSINPAIAALAAALGMTYEATMAKLAEDAVMAMKAGE